MKVICLTAAEAACLVLASFAAAHAAVNEDTVSTASTPLAFAELSAVSHTLKATLDAFPTPVNETVDLALGRITGPQGATLAARWTPLTPTQWSSNCNKGYVTGNTTGYTMELHLTPTEAQTFNLYAGDGWCTFTLNPANYSIATNGMQYVAPDSYTISVDAGIWTN